MMHGEQFDPVHTSQCSGIGIKPYFAGVNIPDETVNPMRAITGRDSVLHQPIHIVEVICPKFTVTVVIPAVENGFAVKKAELTVIKAYLFGNEMCGGAYSRPSGSLKFSQMRFV